MRTVNENEIVELVRAGRMSAKDRLRSNIAPMPVSETNSEDRMAASLEKLAVLTSTIAAEMKNRKEEATVIVPENDKLVETLDKMAGLIEMLLRRIENPPVKNKKSYDINVERDNNGFAESWNIKEK